MTTRKRRPAKTGAKSTPAKSASAPIETKVEFSPDRRLTVSVGTCLNFGKAKLGIALSENVKPGADPLEVADTMFESLTEKLQEKFDVLCETLGVEEVDEEFEDDEEEGQEPDDSDESESEDDEEWEDDDEGEDEGDDEGEDEDDDEGDDEGDEDDDYTEEELRKLKKADLLEIIKEEELDVDPKEFKKIAELKDAVVDAYFADDAGEDEGEDEGGDDEEWEDEEWDDDDE